MKPARRFEADIHRRDSRDRDVSRFNRKRPSMLSEFKHYSHRESDRMSPDHVRYSRHSHDSSPGLTSEGRFTFPGKPKSDSRVKRIFSPLAGHHSNYRPSHHYSPSYNRMDSLPSSSEGGVDEEAPAKRACLSVDVTKRASDPMNSAESASSNHVGGQSPNVATKSGGLSSYHLEDIDSDDDSLLDDPKTKPPDKSPDKPAKTEKPSKDELLVMMERVDRDISTLENQIASLQKKQAELKDGGWVSPMSPATPSTPSPELSTDLDRHPVSEHSLLNSIYTENQSKASTANGMLHSHIPHTKQLHPSMPLYFQPSDSPFYHDNIISHRKFRPRLIAHLRSIKMAAHQKDLSLCKQYDSLMNDWERRMERIENSSKKKARDLKNRELFEKTFPELKARREQQERFTRVDQRGFGVVRSDAELHEILYELSNKEEAPARYRRTHAVIPPMLSSDAPRFHSSNGHIEDVMALHRELRFTNTWNEEEKAVFREKFLHYPKNFEMISKFIPNKSPSECVKYYYLTKKSENFKQLVRKANLKRKKALIKPGNLSISSSLPASPLASHHPTMLPAKAHQITTEDFKKAKPDYADWSENNISRLKEGLRKFGRAWGKVYREVGGSKTATQCKMFYDDYCSDKQLDLQEALLEHSRAKKAENQRRKSQSRKPPPIDTKRKTPHKAAVAAESDNTESGSESDSSGSESTITDSGQEETPAPPTEPSKPAHKKTRVKKPRLSISSPPLSAKTSEDVVDLFLTAAEALRNNVSPDIALHDHTYSLPHSELANNVDLQGSSGLSLIAAAAAVVSPNLSRNANKNSVSPVRAPRGRPPNKYRGTGPNSTVKLSPTYLSPAGGTSAHVLLSDLKSSAFRNRTRSAPTDRPKSSTIHISRSGSTLARVPLATSTPGRKQPYTKQRSNSPSLKTMISVSQPQTASAFEALVNVAVAAPPAELPKTSTAVVSKTKKPATPTMTPSPGNSSMSGKLTLSRTNSNDSNNSSLNNGTTATAYIDVSHAINMLASLAHQTPGMGNSHTVVFPASTHLSQSPALPKHSPSLSTTTANVDHLLTHLKSTPLASTKPSSRTRKQGKTESGKAAESSGDDLSNLKLLSSLVAAVAGTPSPLSVATASGDTTTQSTPSGKFPAPSIQQWDVQGKSPNSPNQWNMYNNNNSESDDLPRGVVRPSLATYSASTTADMTASLASIIPSYNPSVGQQSTLLLYTRSRSFPQNSDNAIDEEDHLESATRGISELSKLLGTDSQQEPDPLISKKGHDLASSFLHSTESMDTPSNGTTSLTRVVLSDITTPGPPANKRGLLESHTNNSEGSLNMNTQTMR